MLYARCMGLAEDVAYPLNPPPSQATRSHSGKAKSYEPIHLLKAGKQLIKKENEMGI